jgi:hypothetical protein
MIGSYLRMSSMGTGVILEKFIIISILNAGMERLKVIYIENDKCWLLANTVVCYRTLCSGNYHYSCFDRYGYTGNSNLQQEVLSCEK